jgi:hypothetical protein
MKYFQRSIIMSVLKSIGQRVWVDEIPLAIATRSLRVTHFLILSEKIRLSFNSWP